MSLQNFFVKLPLDVDHFDDKVQVGIWWDGIASTCFSVAKAGGDVQLDFFTRAESLNSNLPTLDDQTGTEFERDGLASDAGVELFAVGLELAGVVNGDGVVVLGTVDIGNAVRHALDQPPVL